MIKLLDFQRAAIDSLLDFFKVCGELINSPLKAKKKDVDYSAIAWLTCGLDTVKPYCSLKTTTGVSIPNAAISVPTGGGKTIIGIAAAIETAKYCISSEKKNFTVWLVPSESIYKQVKKEFYRGGLYFDFVKSTYGKKLNLKLHTDVWTDDDFDTDNFTVLVLTYQSIIRKKSNKNLQIYKNADKVSGLTGVFSRTQTPSLFGLIQSLKPIFVIDEAHRYYTEIGRDFFRNDDIASWLIELTATPKQYSFADTPNIVFSATGAMLISDQLIKRPIVYHSLSGFSLEELMGKVIERHNRVTQVAAKEGLHIYPKVLISSEFTGVEMASEPYSAQSIKLILLKSGIPSDLIAIKSSEIDELGNRNMDSPDERVRYIITKRALMEGWDCKSIYSIVMVNNIGADVTNFQLIGRGLRQPHRQYYKNTDLNELHLYTNSQSHDSAVARLTSYLAECGLAEDAKSFLVMDDSRSSHTLVLHGDALLYGFDIDNKYIFSKSYIENEISYKLDELFIDEKELPSPEETTQRISLSRDGLHAGFPQGRSSPAESYMVSSGIVRNKLQNFLFTGLESHVPDSVKLYEFVESQINKFSDINKVYLVRESLLSILRFRINELRVDCLSIYFKSNAPKHLVKNCEMLSIKNIFPYVVRAHPDIALNSPFVNSLIGDIPKSLFNDDELDFARFIDGLPDVKWFRNFPLSGLALPYAYGNFYPDFIISFNQVKGRPMTIYVETKGAHLIGSNDSTAKEIAADLMSKINPVEIRVIFGSFVYCKAELANLVVH